MGYPHQARIWSITAKCFYQPTKRTSLLVFFSRDFFFFCKFFYVAEPDSCWQVQGGPFNSLSPKSLFPVLGAELAVPAAACSRGPWAQGRGTVLPLRPYPFQPAPSALGPRAAGPHQRGGGGCSSRQLFPLPFVRAGSSAQPGSH